MTLSINTNVSALTAQRNLSISSNRSANSIAKLSSGSRITTAKDDAAALAIASGLKLDLASLRAAQSNVSQATAILQIADGGYSQLGEVFNRLQTLATSAQSDQISATERGFLNTEYQQLLSEIDRIADSTEFNGIELLGGAASLDIDPGTLGTDLVPANGFVGFEFNAAVRTAGESLEVTYDEVTQVFSVSVYDAAGGSGAGNLVASQSVDLNDIAGNPFNIGGTGTLDAGNTFDINFGSIGLTLTMNSDFDTAAAGGFGGDFATGGVDVLAGAGTTATNLNFLVGVSTTDVVSITLQVGNAAALGVGGSAVDTIANAQGAAQAIDTAVQNLNTARATLGATLSRLEFAGSNVAIQVENSEAARSTLEDVNVAEEFTNFTSSQVLVQAGVSILAQANQQPSLLLQLLQ